MRSKTKNKIMATLTSTVRNFASEFGFDINTTSNGKTFCMSIVWNCCGFGTIAIVEMSENIKNQKAKVITDLGAVTVTGSEELRKALVAAWAA